MSSFMLNKNIYKPCQYFVLFKILSEELTQRLEDIFSTVILASHSFLQFVAFIGVVVRL